MKKIFVKRWNWPIFFCFGCFLILGLTQFGTWALVETPYLMLAAIAHNQSWRIPEWTMPQYRMGGCLYAFLSSFVLVWPAVFLISEPDPFLLAVVLQCVTVLILRQILRKFHVEKKLSMAVPWLTWWEAICDVGLYLIISVVVLLLWNDGVTIQDVIFVAIGMASLIFGRLFAEMVIQTHPVDPQKLEKYRTDCPRYYERVIDESRSWLAYRLAIPAGAMLILRSVILRLFFASE